MDSNEPQLGKLTEESLKRKERLRLLREKATRQEDNDSSSANESQPLPKPVFRSYKPQNEDILGEVLPQKPTGDIEEAVEPQLELVKAPELVEEIDLTNLAPRKPDWDLKRDVAKKLEKLERRTQKAIAELIRIRLKVDENPQDLDKLVNVGTATNTTTTAAITVDPQDEY